MTHPFSFRAVSLAVILSISGSAAAIAATLPELSPADIAKDVERRYNSETGQTDYIAKDFDPFEHDDALAGSASLRTAGTVTSIDGQTLSGGAILDLSVIYTTDSPDDFDIRGFEQADYLSGEDAAIVRYNNETLDCSQNTREIVYNDDYYSGVRYGYIAGIYRLYPRYRGHRHYGWHYDYGHRYNNGRWGTYRPRYGRAYGRGYRQGYRDGYRHDNRHDSDRDRRDRNPDGRRHDRRRDQAGNGESRRDRGGANNRRRNAENATMERIPQNRIRTQPRSNETRRRRGEYRTPERAGKNPATRSRQQSRSRPSRTTQAVVPPTSAPRATRPAAQRRVTNTPRPQRATPRPQTQRATPRPQTQRSAPRPQRQSRPKNTLDRAFRPKNPSGEGKRHMRFYPLMGTYARTDVYVNYRCVKEERLSVHISKDRLDAARFDGLTLVLLDNEGRDQPVFIPPNYIEGFRQAAKYRLDGSAPTIYKAPSSTVSPSYPPAQVTPQPSQSGTAPVNPSSREPIIYGDPGTPAVPGRYPQPGE